MMKSAFCTLAPRRVAAFLTAAFAVVLSGAASARPISADDAKIAAENWLNGQTRLFDWKSASAASAETVETETDGEGKALFHVVGTDAGVFLVLSAESGVEPVVAVCGSATGRLDPDGPLAKILAGDMAIRIENAEMARAAAGREKSGSDGAGDSVAEAEGKWAELLDAESGKFGRTSISDVRVSQLVQSKWDQGNVGSSYCYNYYTPNHYPCGCVATAAAQVMRFWQFPTASIPVVSRTCKVAGVETTRSTRGGTFAWSSMPLVPSSSMTTAQRQAIGHLCYDVGVVAKMSWNSGSSGSSGFRLPSAMTGVFGYASALCCTHANYGDTSVSFSQSQIQNAIWANLDAGCPAILGIYGHEVVADGYGYQSSTPYTHLNMGWSGEDDIWYNLPTVDADGYTSTALDEIVFNINPNRSGDLLTGRVLNSSGQPVSGASVRAAYGSQSYSATSNAKGIFAMWLPGGRTYSVSATSGSSSSSSKSVYVTACISEDETDPFGSGTIGNSWGNELTISGGPDPNSPLQEAVDNYSLTFTTGGNADWYYQTYESYDGSDSARSGSIGSNGETWMQATGASGSGILTFRWKISSEVGYDWIEFYIDGDFKFGWSGTGADWRYEAFKVGSGAHTFKWVYVKDGSVNSGSDCAWVDQVKFCANSPLSPVYRFYSRNYKGHFFTMNEGEMIDLIENNPNWNYEGVAYFAYPNSLNGTVPLYRFYSKNYRGHFYTRDYDEYWTVRYTNPNWKYEGEAYYIKASSGMGSTPIYRFWSKAYRHHFYTADYDEYWTVRYTNPNWNYEGIAFYAWETPESLSDYNYSSGRGFAENGPIAGETISGVPDESSGGFDSAGTPGGRGISGAGVFPVGAFTLEVREDAPDADELAAAKPVELPAPFAMPTLKIVVPDGVSETSLWSSSSGETPSGAPENGAFEFVPENAGEWTWFRAFGEDGETAVSLWLRLVP